MSLKVVRKSEHYHMEKAWLSTYWHFSFDEYFDPDNVSFGPLRVFNDDTVQPGGGWGMHPHRDMEIVTYVVRGVLEHSDSEGSKVTLTEGGVQHMTAGRGIWHSERNPSAAEVLRFLQIWILPDRRGLEPHHEARQFSKSEMENVLLPVVSRDRLAKALSIHQDVNIFASTLTTGAGIDYRVEDGRRGYLYIVEGRVRLDDCLLREGEAVRIVGKEDLGLSAEGESELILLDLPMGQGSGSNG